MLLDALRDSGALRRFVPFDVDASVLKAAGSAIEKEYPGIEIDAVCGDFEEHLGKIPRVGRRLFVFLGSTIGNLTPGPRADFLAALSETLQAGDSLLLGTDLVKDADRLVRAYDDSAGVTAKFNRNVLAVVNRELDADFNLDAFEHVARWNTDEERIEMWLRATEAQRVQVKSLDLTIDFADGEEMLTEVSCKFRPDRVATELARFRTSPHPLVDRQRGRLRSVAGDQMSLAEQWRSARPKVAGLHLDSAACSRQSFAVIDAAAQHARHEAEVGGYVAADSATPVLDAGRAAIGALTGLSGSDVVYTTGANDALDMLLSSWPGERTVACLVGEYGPNLAIMAANGFDVRALPVDGDGRLDVDAATRALATDRPALVHLTALASHRGVAQPMAALADVCRGLGPSAGDRRGPGAGPSRLRRNAFRHLQLLAQVGGGPARRRVPGAAAGSRAAPAATAPSTGVGTATDGDAAPRTG